MASWRVCVARRKTWSRVLCFACERFLRFGREAVAWTILFRVGEARNPGPNLTFLCANITSLRTRWPSIQHKRQADVFLWQEVILGLDAQNITSDQLRENSLHAQWPAPQPTERPKATPGCRRPRVTPWSVKQSGAAVAARQEIPMYPDNMRDALRREFWETQRWAAAALPFGDGKKYLHVRNAYAEASASTDDRLLAHSEIFLQNIFAEAASRERSDTLDGLFTSGRWIDVSYEVAADRDQLQATYHKDGVLPGAAQFGATRIDFSGLQSLRLGTFQFLPVQS